MAESLIQYFHFRTFGWSLNIELWKRIKWMNDLRILKYWSKKSNFQKSSHFFFSVQNYYHNVCWDTCQCQWLVWTVPRAAQFCAGHIHHLPLWGQLLHSGEQLNLHSGWIRGSGEQLNLESCMSGPATDHSALPKSQWECGPVRPLCPLPQPRHGGQSAAQGRTEMTGVI